MPIHFASGAGLLTTPNTSFWSGATRLAFGGWFRVPGAPDRGAGTSHLFPWCGRFQSFFYTHLSNDGTAGSLKFEAVLRLASGQAGVIADGIQLGVAYHWLFAHDELTGSRLLLNALPAGTHGSTAAVATGATGLLYHSDSTADATPGPAGWVVELDDLAIWVGAVPTAEDAAGLRDRLVSPAAVRPESLAYLLSLDGTADAPVALADPGLTNAGTAVGEGDITTIGTPAPTWTATALEFAWPVEVTRARIGPSGKLLELAFATTGGTPTNLTAIDTHPTLTVAGTPVDLGSPGPIWGDTTAERLPYVTYPLATAVTSGQAVTLDAPGGWATTAAGRVGPLEAQAVTVLAAGERLGPTFVAEPKTMTLGYNVAALDYFRPARGLADLARTAPAYDAPVPPPGGLTDQGLPVDGTLAGGRVILSKQGSNANGVNNRGYQNAPMGGTPYPLVWDGPGEAYLTGYTPTADTYDGTDTTHRRDYVLGPETAGDYGPSAMMEFTGNVRAVHLYLPGIDPVDPPTFDPAFLAQAADARSLRFMQANYISGDVWSNASAASDFLRSGYSFGRALEITQHVRVNFDLVEPYDNAGQLFPPADQVYLKLRTTAPHGLKDGQVVAFESVSGPITLVGGGTIGLDTALIEAIDATHVGVSYFAFGGATINPAQAISGTIDQRAVPGLPVETELELCGAVGSGADCWLTLPRLTTEAACDAIAAAVLASPHLPAGRKLRVEYMNEAWNSSAPYYFDYIYCRGMGMRAGLDADSTTAGVLWYALRTAEIHARFRAAFTAAGRADDFIGVFASHTFSPDRTTLLADYCADPGSYPAQPGGWDGQPIPLDELAIAPYPSNGPVGSGNTAAWDSLDVAQLLDLAELYYQHAPDLTTAWATHRAALDAAGFTATRLVCYEAAPQIGCPVYSEATRAAAAERSRQWYRHPRYRGLMLQFLQALQDAGCSHCEYFILNADLGGIPGTDRNAAWSAYYGQAMTAGVGDGSDGQFDNTSDYEALDQLVSVAGLAHQDWMALAGGEAPAPAPRSLMLTTAGGLSLALCY